MKFSIKALNLAATDVARSAAFYSGVLGIEFTEHEIEGGTLHAANVNGIEFVLVPAALAGVKAAQNRMQLDVFVPDLDELIRRVEASEGRTNGRLGEDDEVRAIGVWDPDENFIVFKQRK